MNFTDAETKVLKEMAEGWIEEGFTSPPYTTEHYNIFEKLELNPKRFIYDIERPKGMVKKD